MQGVEVIEVFEPPLQLAPVNEVLGAYMLNPAPPRNHDPRAQMRGSTHYPLTERIAADLSTHGEAWTRNYCRARGLDGAELDVFIDSAKRYLADCAGCTADAETGEPV